MTRHSFFDRIGGYTLVEAIVVLSILAVLAIAGYGFIRNYFQLTSWTTGELSREARVRAVIKNFANEVRGAASSDVGSYLLEKASSTELIFYSDINGDGKKDRVRYTLVGGITLQKGVVAPTGSPASYNLASEATSTIVTDIVGPAEVFTYFDNSYTGVASTTDPLPQPTNIPLVRIITITLTVDPNGSLPPAPATYTAQGFIRNLKGQ